MPWIQALIWAFEPTEVIDIRNMPEAIGRGRPQSSSHCEDGLVSPVDEGTPEGGPLSPILSNLVLDDLDKELARRGHRLCRYADDCNIYVHSRRAGERVMASVSRFLTSKLRLKVNAAKSAVARPEERKFLGFSISNDGSERRIAPKALDKFKGRIRDMTRRTRGFSGRVPWRGVAEAEQAAREARFS